MSVAPLSAAQLHEPILPLARPAHVLLQPDQTIAETLDRIRGSANATSMCFLSVSRPTYILLMTGSSHA